MNIDEVLALKPTPPQAVFFDGASSRKRSVALAFGADLAIVEGETTLASWAYDDIRRVDAPSGMLRLMAVGAPELARLETRDRGLIREITARCGQLDIGSSGHSATLRIVGWSFAAAASIAGIIIYGIPLIADRLTPFVPVSLEQRLGQAVDNQIHVIFHGKVCANAAGQQAMTKLVGALQSGAGLPGPVNAAVVDTSVENAFALPGGKVVLLRGLLQKAQTADELAGVLAHELGHVRHRDSVRVMINNGGTAFLLGLLFGDMTGSGAIIFASRTMLDNSYTREAEAAADQVAVDTMHRLGRSPKPMGELLFRVTGAERSKSMSFLSNHPLTEDRLAMMTREDRPVTGPDLLTPAEWQALKTICSAAK
jgi:predicted Zn-dependent protease